MRLGSPIRILTVGFLALIGCAIPSSIAQDASGLGSGPKLLRDSLPKYPRDAQKHKVEGIVKLHLTISTDGSVTNAAVVSGDHILGDAAKVALMNRRYEHLPQGAQPAEIRTAICFVLTKVRPLVFAIDNSEEESEFAEVLEHQVGVTPPRAIYTPDPAYTSEALANKLQGISVLELIIDKQGQARYAMPIRKLGDGLDENAVQTVKQWKFQPATKDGLPVPTLATVEVAFHLH
jgi:TonB family protein